MGECRHAGLPGLDLDGRCGVIDDLPAGFPDPLERPTLSPAEVGELLTLSPVTVRRYARAGELGEFIMLHGNRTMRLVTASLREALVRRKRRRSPNPKAGVIWLDPPQSRLKGA